MRGRFAVRAGVAETLRRASHHVDAHRLCGLGGWTGSGAPSGTRSSRHQRYALTRSQEDRRARASAVFKVDLVKPLDRRDDMPPVRRLTAILAADVAGYSRLMGADEYGTHERLKAHLG